MMPAGGIHAPPGTCSSLKTICHYKHLIRGKLNHDWPDLLNIALVIFLLLYLTDYFLVSLLAHLSRQAHKMSLYYTLTLAAVVVVNNV